MERVAPQGLGEVLVTPVAAREEICVELALEAKFAADSQHLPDHPGLQLVLKLATSQVVSPEIALLLWCLGHLDRSPPMMMMSQLSALRHVAGIHHLEAF